MVTCFANVQLLHMPAMREIKHTTFLSHRRKSEVRIFACKVSGLSQAPVVQTLGCTMHWITQLVLLVFICWIMIYLVDSAIHRLNIWGQIFKLIVCASNKKIFSNINVLE